MPCPSPPYGPRTGRPPPPARNLPNEAGITWPAATPRPGQPNASRAYGMNGIAEAVRQVRGSSVNQVPGDGPVLVTAGTGVPASGLVLSGAR